jgi:aminoglycoside 2'-N-acetyltransferase I
MSRHTSEARAASRPLLQPEVMRRHRSAFSDAELDDVLRFCSLAFEGDPDDWGPEHWETVWPGEHFLATEDRSLVAHACVIERDLRVDGRSIRTGYVEDVCTRNDRRRRGYGTSVMAAASKYLAERFDLGALATGTTAFYEPMGWLRWEGPILVRTDGGDVPGDAGWEADDAVMVLSTPTTPGWLERSLSISCEWRPDEPW